jgi:hypothetical protein
MERNTEERALVTRMSQEKERMTLSRPCRGGQGKVALKRTVPGAQEVS